MTKKRLLIAGAAILALAIIGALVYFFTRPTPPSIEFQVRSVVNGLGDELGQVALAGAPADVAKAMDEHYSLYVRPDLLEQWKASPLLAPGRPATGPKPNRIVIQAATKKADGTYTIDATIVARAGTDGASSLVGKNPVRFTLALGPDGWQISQYEAVGFPQ